MEQMLVAELFENIPAFYGTFSSRYRVLCQLIQFHNLIPCILEMYLTLYGSLSQAVFPFQFFRIILCMQLSSPPFPVCIFLIHYLNNIRRKVQITELILGPKIIVSAFLSNTLKLCYVS